MLKKDKVNVHLNGNKENITKVNTMTSYASFESLFSQLQNEPFFDFIVGHSRSRDQAKENLHLLEIVNF